MDKIDGLLIIIVLIVLGLVGVGGFKLGQRHERKVFLSVFVSSTETTYQEGFDDGNQVGYKQGLKEGETKGYNRCLNEDYKIKESY